MKLIRDLFQDVHRPTVAMTAPLITYLVGVSMYPDFESDQATGANVISAATIRYMLLLAGQIFVSAALLWHFRDVYRQQFPAKLTIWGPVFGIVGVVLWIAFCNLGVEHSLMRAIGMGGAMSNRPAFNPFTNLPGIGWQIAFLVPRFLLLAAIVPMIEELFLRGWLVRYIQDPNFEPVGYAGLGFMALLAPTIYGVATHPGEATAAIVWFSLITLLMMKTRNLWDCVMAHAVTNLLLGLYVIQYSQWQLW